MNRRLRETKSWAQERRGISRRDALQRAIGGAAGAAMVWFAHGSARAGAVKLNKAAVGYVETGNFPGQDCDDCVQFVAGATAHAGATCKIVEGEISPHGHCIAFAPKPKS